MKHFTERLTWYWARFNAMSCKEIVFRVFEAARKTRGRRYNRGWEQFSKKVTFRPVSNLHSRARFLSYELAELIAIEVKAIRSGSFAMLGACWPRTTIPPPLNFWLTNPQDGTLWPKSKTYCFDVVFRHGVAVQEIKQLWEINRLQFLVPLAAYAARNSDTATRDLVTAIIFNWMEANPPYRGPNWVSQIEHSLRVISVSLALSFIGMEHINYAEHERLSQFFAAHVFWIARFPSRYSSANNHRVAELSGLIAATTITADLPNAERLRAESWAALEVELDRQILADGSGAEQSPHYTAFMVELALVAAFFGKENGLVLSSAARARLCLWAEQARWLMDEEGCVPAIGDWDDGRVIALTQRPEPRYVAFVVAAVSAMCERPELVPPARDRQLRDFIFESPNGTIPLTTGAVTFPKGGMSVVRRHTPSNFMLVFDHGPLGYLSIAAHGHADTLAIWLHIRNRPVLIDAGTGLYFSKPKWRQRFRSSLVHNTLTIAEINSSTPSGPFNWAGKANCRLLDSSFEPHPKFVAEHDGYLDRFSCWHRRTIEVPESSVIVVTDELVGAEVNEPVIISFLVEPSLKTAVETTNSVRIDDAGRPILRIEGNGSLTAGVVRGDADRELGWVSPSFGIRVPADQILFSGVLGSRHSILRLTLID